MARTALWEKQGQPLMLYCGHCSRCCPCSPQVNAFCCTEPGERRRVLKLGFPLCPDPRGKEGHRVTERVLATSGGGSGGGRGSGLQRQVLGCGTTRRVAPNGDAVEGVYWMWSGGMRTTRLLLCSGTSDASAALHRCCEPPLVCGCLLAGLYRPKRIKGFQKNVMFQ